MASLVGQDMIIVSPPSQDCLYCFLYRMCAARELSMESASFIFPDLSMYSFSTSAWVHGSARLETPVLKWCVSFSKCFFLVGTYEWKSNPLSYTNSSKIFIYNFDHISETSQRFIPIFKTKTKSNTHPLGNEESF